VKAPFAILALLCSTTVHAEEPDAAKPLTGGPAAGMYPGDVVARGNGISLVALKASRPNASPVPAPLAAIVDALLKSNAAGEQQLPNALVADGALSEFCPATDKVFCESPTRIKTFALPERDDFNTPYYLADGDVRIEWMRGTDVRYLTFLEFQNGRVRHLRTILATIPMANAAPATNGSNHG
jgi:hypothetical protein